MPFHLRRKERISYQLITVRVNRRKVDPIRIDVEQHPLLDPHSQHGAC